jgi:hypothetical protein
MPKGASLAQITANRTARLENGDAKHMRKGISGRDLCCVLAGQQCLSHWKALTQHARRAARSLTIKPTRTVAGLKPKRLATSHAGTKSCPEITAGVTAGVQMLQETKTQLVTTKTKKRQHTILSEPGIAACLARQQYPQNVGCCTYRCLQQLV